MKRFYYMYLAMPFYRIYTFVMPTCVPLNFKMTDNIFEIPRRPFPWAWTIKAIRKYQLWSMCRALTKRRAL
jgi:hypothetical protein